MQVIEMYAGNQQLKKEARERLAQFPDDIRFEKIDKKLAQFIRLLEAHQLP